MNPVMRADLFLKNCTGNEGGRAFFLYFDEKFNNNNFFEKITEN